MIGWKKSSSLKSGDHWCTKAGGQNINLVVGVASATAYPNYGPFKTIHDRDRFVKLLLIERWRDKLFKLTRRRRTCGFQEVARELHIDGPLGWCECKLRRFRDNFCNVVWRARDKCTLGHGREKTSLIDALVYNASIYARTAHRRGNIRTNYEYR
jgi:hypothetical protein